MHSSLNNLDYLKKYKLFIVDYDGTILDSMGMWSKLLSNFLKDEGIEFDVDIDELAKEQTNHESVKYMNEHYFKDLSFDELADKMYSYVRKEYVKQVLKPNATKLLTELKKHGRVVLFSATAIELLNDSFKTNNVNEYFDYIYSASDLGTTKTNGVGYEVIIDYENAKKEEVLVVEDVYHGIEGARFKSIDTLAIYDKQKHWDDIKKISTYNLVLEEL